MTAPGWATSAAHRGSASAQLGGPAVGQPVGARAGVRAIGGLALAASVCCSAWLALGAAGGGYLVELPGGTGRRWVDGPLHGLAAAFGWFGPDRFTVGLIGCGGAYLVALACARAIPERWALAAAAAAIVAFTVGPTIVSSDVFGYIAYARETAHGLDPYVSPPIALGHDGILALVYWKHQTSPYGPLFTIASTPLGLLSAPGALWLYKAAAGLAAITITVLVGRIAGARGADPARAAIFVGLNPVLLLYAVSGGHNDLLAALLVLCAVALTIGRREVAGASVAVAALAVKATLGIALPFILIGAERRRRAVAGALVALVALAIPTLALFGIHVLDQLHRIASDPRFDIEFSGPDSLARALGTGIDSPLRVGCTAAALAAAAVALVRAWRGWDWITAAGWAVLALLASIASLAPWYLVWLLPLAALGRGRSLRIAALLATGYLLAVHLPALGGQPWLRPADSHLSGRALALLDHPAGRSAAPPRPG